MRASKAATTSKLAATNSAVSSNFFFIVAALPLMRNRSVADVSRSKADLICKALSSSTNQDYGTACAKMSTLLGDVGLRSKISVSDVIDVGR
jgi:hypothetical protein